MTSDQDAALRKTKIWFFALGLITAVALGGTVFTVMYFQGAAPTMTIRDRVRSVVLTWSGADTIADSDKLETVWAATRKSGHHDFDFQPGGADELSKMLKTEFKNPPARTISLTPRSFAPQGAIATFDDLVQAIK